MLATALVAASLVAAAASTIGTAVPEAKLPNIVMILYAHLPSHYRHRVIAPCLTDSGLTTARSLRRRCCRVDDLGHGGIMDNNPLVKGPRVSELKAEGVYLARHYGAHDEPMLLDRQWSQPAAMS